MGEEQDLSVFKVFLVRANMLDIGEIDGLRCIIELVWRLSRDFVVSIRCQCVMPR